MKILFLASEVAPFSKTGGLADVAGALPAALARRGHQVRVVTPFYGTIRDRRIQPLRAQVRLQFPFGEEVASLHCAKLAPGLQIWLLKHPAYFDRQGVYQEAGQEYGDNDRRFAFLSVGGLATAQVLGFNPDIVHLNDWQTGLAALALKRGYQGTPLAKAKSLFTIHNLAYQGNFPKASMDAIGIPWDAFTPQGLEFYDRVSFLKAGVVYADAVTTVSRKYAQEIRTPEYGFGMDGVLRGLGDRLHGVLNGVDYGEWDPGRDPHLPHPYGPDDLAGKSVCRRGLMEAFGLRAAPGAESGPVFGVVSRLAHQKGIDLLLEVMPRVLERNAFLAVLGNGEAWLEDALRALSARFPGRAGVRIGFDPALSHLVEAGSDFFLMPSRFEPSGLNQMYSLRYGTIPVVRATGGLDDTVEDLSSPAANGIKFKEFSAQALMGAIEQALALYADPKRLKTLRRRGMRCDFSWDVSARQYEAVYRSTLGWQEGDGVEAPLPASVRRGP